MHASKHPSPASITIRNLDRALKERLRVREAPPARHLYDRVRARFAPLGGVDLEPPPRDPVREPPRFD
jgi:hypothetical protein